jgi:RND family efflux transporter MFP subunit
VASAEQIVADQASLAAAQANLAVAQQNVTLATLTSPIAGTVAAVGISAGSSVSAGSSSQVISVIGDNGWVVDTSVTASTIGPLKVGQSASVNVSGVAGAQTAKVTSIGFLNTSSDSSTPSYDVTLALSGAGTGLLNGASAQLTVDVEKANGVLTVPSSAVHLGTGSTYSVYVLSDGKESTRQVKVGAIGSDRTQITSGLSAGDQVILADLSSTVSSDSTQTSTRGGTLGGLTGGGSERRIVGGTGGTFGGGFGGGTGTGTGTGRNG